MTTCPKCPDPIHPNQEVVLVDTTTFCRKHAKTTTILDYAQWRDASTGADDDDEGDGELGPGWQHHNHTIYGPCGKQCPAYGTERPRRRNPTIAPRETP